MSTVQVETPPVATAAAPGAAKPVRDGHGRFTVGNAGGPGNPFAREVAALKKEFVKAAKERLPKIVDKLFTLAEEGNVAAIKLVLQYTYGKATEPPNPDRVDADEWQRFKETAGMMAEMPQLLGKPDPVVPLSLVRNVRPDVTRSFSGQMGVALADPDAFHAAEEKARQAHFRQLEQDSLRAAAKYDGFVPDETGLPPEVRPIQPKGNGQNGRKTRSARVSDPADGVTAGLPDPNGDLRSGVSAGSETRAERGGVSAASKTRAQRRRGPKANEKNGGQHAQRAGTPKANGKNRGRRPARREPPAPGQREGTGGVPSASRFIEGLPDWCPPIPLSDEPLADPGTPSAIGKNGPSRAEEPGPAPSFPGRLSAGGGPPSPIGKNGEATD